MTGPALSGSTVLLVHRDPGLPNPRVTRAEWLEKALRDPELGGDGGMRVVRWPRPTPAVPGRTGITERKGLRGILGDQAARMFIDRHEPKMWLRGRSIPTDGIDASLVVSMPASPASLAAGRLCAAGIPYVVDQGDPWGIGTEAFRGRGFASRRRKYLECRMWEGAVGGVFTTQSQAEAVLELVPDLPYLIRINGYRPFARVVFEDAFARRKDPDGVLRLAHFGSLKIGTIENPRVDAGETLAALAESGLWRRVVFTQFGHLPDGFAGGLSSAGIEIERRDRISWDQAPEVAAEFDAALVIGNHSFHRARVPSKVIEYLSLPIPRIALTSGVNGDELASVARSLPGYLAGSAADSELAERIDSFLRREWTLDDLLPPVEYRWDRVAADVVQFFLETVRIR